MDLEIALHHAGRAAERGLAGQHVIDEQPQRVDVRARIDGLPAHLLGRHRGRRAQHAPRGREPWSDLIDELHQPEIEEDRPQATLIIPRKDHVRWLHVAMDEARVVSDREGVAQRLEDLHHLVRRQRAALDQDVAQARALQELEHEVRAAIGDGAVVERANHVLVAQALDGLELALEPRHRVRRADELEVEDLDRHHLAIRHAERAPDLTEAALPDRAFDLESRDLRAAARSPIDLHYHRSHGHDYSCRAR